MSVIDSTGIPMVGYRNYFHLTGASPTPDVGRKERIGVFSLRSYSSEPNPKEHLNANPKQILGRKVPVRTKAKLRDTACKHMAMLERSLERARSPFQGPRAQYAA